MDRRGERGFVLVVVLGVLAILTVVALGFAHRAVLDRRAAALTLDHAQALMLARGAVQRGIVQLRNQSAALVTVPPGAAKNPGPVWRQHPNLVEEGLVQLDADGTGDTVDYAIEDLESRISLNSAPEELLEEIDFLDLGTMTAILKRREVEPGEPPHPFLVVEELRALEDFDEEEWIGDDETPGLADLLTTWGDGRINLNTASQEVLECVPGASDSAVEAIVAYRRGEDGLLNTADDLFFEDFEDVAAKTELSADRLMPFRLYCKLDSRFFTITGFATRRQGKVKATCTATVEVRQDRVEVLQWREGPLGS